MDPTFVGTAIKLSQSLRPTACPRGPENHDESEISGSRGQAAGRRIT